MSQPESVSLLFSIIIWSVMIEKCTFVLRFGESEWQCDNLVNRPFPSIPFLPLIVKWGCIIILLKQDFYVTYNQNVLISFIQTQSESQFEMKKAKTRCISPILHWMEEMGRRTAAGSIHLPVETCVSLCWTPGCCSSVCLQMYGNQTHAYVETIARPQTQRINFQ